MIMTVKELIKKLSNFNPNAVIIRHGHSDGDDFESVESLQNLTIVAKTSDDWAGEFRTPYRDEEDGSCQGIDAVLIF